MGVISGTCHHAATLLEVLAVFLCSSANTHAGSSNQGYQHGIATWYGEPNGPGSNGGACGYGYLPGSPYSNRIAAAGDAFFKNGAGCGTCYEVKCTERPCHDNPVRVVVTDRCPECGANHFDLSGAAISSLGEPGRGADVRGIGVIGILYRRVACTYPTAGLTFKIDEGSNAWWLAFFVKYVDGAGDLKSVEVLQHGRSVWQKMSRNWGASYKSQQFYPGPLSVRITTLEGLVIVCRDSIPAHWKAGASYTCSTS